MRLTTLPHKYPAAKPKLFTTVPLLPVNAMLVIEIFVHGSTALHWKLATVSVAIVPVTLEMATFRIWNLEFVQLMFFAPLKVVHCEMVKGVLVAPSMCRLVKLRSVMSVTVFLSAWFVAFVIYWVPLTAESAAAAVGWVADLISCPCFEVNLKPRQLLSNSTRKR